MSRRHSCVASVSLRFLWRHRKSCGSCSRREIDAFKGDMLVVIDDGVRRFLAGMNPYTLYQVPREAPLPYGPWPWLPFALPFALQVDPRVLTLGCHLITPAACVPGSACWMKRGRRLLSVLLLCLGASE